MYVLIENEQIIHIGPIHWNQKMFQNYIKDDLELDISLSIQNTSLDPIVINNTLKILPAILEYPELTIQKLNNLLDLFGMLLIISLREHLQMFQKMLMWLKEN